MIFGAHGGSGVNYVGEGEAATKLLTASLATLWIAAQRRGRRPVRSVRVRARRDGGAPNTTRWATSSLDDESAA
jgi:hypothetical protein